MLTPKKPSSKFTIKKFKGKFVFDSDVYLHAISPVQHFINMVWLDACETHYMLYQPFTSFRFEIGLEGYKQANEAMVKSMREEMDPDASFLLHLIEKRFTSPACDFNNNHKLLESVIPVLLVNQDVPSKQFVTKVTLRWNRGKTCRLVSCKDHHLAWMKPYAIPYWYTALRTAIKREQGRDAYSHDVIEYLENYHDEIERAEACKHNGDPMIRLAAVYLADYLNKQSSSWLCENSGLINDMVCRLYRNKGNA